jgi:uncharacterized protein YndB with AHSA1/START domain
MSNTGTTAPERFVYVTYIRTTVDKLWDALRKPEFTTQYWFGCTLDCTWEKGAPWRMVDADGSVYDAGSILEIDPPRRMVIKWQHQLRPELKADGWSRATIELEPKDNGTVKLSVLHEMEKAVPGPSQFIAAVSGGWPLIFSNLKTLLETGAVMAQEKDGAR